MRQRAKWSRQTRFFESLLLSMLMAGGGVWSSSMNKNIAWMKRLRVPASCSGQPIVSKTQNTVNAQGDVHRERIKTDRGGCGVVPIAESRTSGEEVKIERAALELWRGYLNSQRFGLVH